LNTFTRFFTAIKKSCGTEFLFPLLSNFHVLVWLTENVFLPRNVLHDSVEGLASLLEAVKLEAQSEGSRGEILANWADNSSHWSEIMAMIIATYKESRPQTFRDALMDGSSASFEADSIVGDSAAGANVWACQHCTFDNFANRTECEMCRLPRSN